MVPVMPNGDFALEPDWGGSALPQPAALAGPAQRPDRCPRIDSTTLLCGGRELEIVHQGAVYRLRLTALGKLILTK